MDLGGMEHACQSQWGSDVEYACMSEPVNSFSSSSLLLPPWPMTCLTPSGLLYILQFYVHKRLGRES